MFKVQYLEIQPEGVSVFFPPEDFSLFPSSLLTPVVLVQSYNMLCYKVERSCVCEGDVQGNWS